MRRQVGHGALRLVSRIAIRAIGTALAVAAGIAACTVPAPPRPVSRPPPPAPAAVPAPPPRPVEEPVVTEPEAEPPEEPSVVIGPVVVRVGLATDLKLFRLPCCDSRLTVRIDDEDVPLDEPGQVIPADGVSRTAVYRVQASALKDEDQARGLAAYLAEAVEQPADAAFDADLDLYKVRCGRFKTRPEAEELRARLTGLGVEESWIVQEGGDLEEAAFQVARGGDSRRVDGRWLAISAPADLGVPAGEVRYRGKILLYLNDRGLINVVNEIDLEAYLRGVVPREMGPELYDRLEALKAQAVAARTYTVRHLEEFVREGYDICSTPRCQVYGGMAVEHPKSDRAVAETAGQVVLFGGEPAETLYSSTCGGHTEDVSVVFPRKNESYLRGVPCFESGTVRAMGDIRPGIPFPGPVLERLLPSSPGKRVRTLAARLEHLAVISDLPVPADRLHSLKRREVLRYTTSVFDMAIDQRLLTPGPALAALTDSPPAEWRPRELRFADYLTSSPLLDETSDGDLEDSDIDRFLYQLARYLGVLTVEDVYFQAVGDGQLEVRRGKERVTVPLPTRLVTFRREGEDLLSGPLETAPGDRLELNWYRDKLLAVVQPVESRAVSLEGRAPKQSWRRFMTDSELAHAVELRYPGFPFEDFEILERGVSGRVGRIRLLGTGRRSLVVEGLAVRWTLDVPDTRFSVRRHRTADRRTGWLFEGQGWGHGVGLCQAGSYAMAVRGLDYREILEHYYSGVELGRVRLTRERPRTASGGAP